MITKNKIVKEKCPWFNADIIRARKKRRAAEKKTVNYTNEKTM